MFENVGKKIQSVSKILVWIGIIVGILIFLSGFLKVIESSQYRYRQAEEAIGCAIMIGGSLLAIGSYVTSLFLFAFGKIVDDIGRISEQLIIIRSQNVSLKTDKDNLPEI